MPSKEDDDDRKTAAEGKARDAKGEEGDEDKECKGGSSWPRVNVLKIEVTPDEQCRVEEELSLSLDFELDRPLKAAHWEVKLIVDSVRTRQVLELGTTAEEDYPSGPSSMSFSVDRVDVSGVKPGALANCGLLVASLRGGAGGSTVVVDVNLVVMVAEVDGRLMRRVFNPLE